MNKIYTLLMITIVNLSFSQDTRIFENVWHLTNVIVNGVNNIPPNGNMNINFASPTDFYAYACNTMHASVVFENNDTNFSASNYSYTLDFCNNPPAESYQNIYFPFFGEHNPVNVYNFTYSITELMGVRTLTINSMFNQQAVYSSVMLSNENFEKIDFSFSPNPSKDYIEINSSNEFTENIIVEFYNEIGQICKSVKLNNSHTKIELNNLSSGIYIVKLKTENKTVTKKLIKI
jgi:hypothetical protein